MTFNLTPNWQAVWTAAEAEQHIRGFKFSGPGIYREKDTTTVVVPHNVPLICDAGRWNIWVQKWPTNQKFRFLVFEGDITDAINVLVSAPTRKDRE